MTLLHLQLGELEYLGKAHGFAIVILGICLHGHRRVLHQGIPGEILIGLSMEWPQKWWTLYHWLPTKKHSCGEH